MKVLIKAGQSLQMLITVGDRTIPCDSMVLEVGNSTFDAAAPRRHGVKIPIKGDTVVVTMVLPDASYTMHCRILKTTDEGLLLAMPPEDDIQRVQRRQFVRVPSSLPCVLEAETKHESGEFGPPVAGHLKDISGGGCGVEQDSAVPIGTLVRLSMDIPEHGAVVFYAWVRRCIPIFTTKGPRHILGIEYMGLNEAVRSKLVLYVNAIQRDMMRVAKTR